MEFCAFAKLQEVSMHSVQEVAKLSWKGGAETKEVTVVMILMRNALACVVADVFKRNEFICSLRYLGICRTPFVYLRTICRVQVAVESARERLLQIGA